MLAAGRLLRPTLSARTPARLSPRGPIFAHRLLGMSKRTKTGRSAPKHDEVGPDTKNLAKRLHGFTGPTVWHEFTPLAIEYKAINLGQGFPGWPCPDFVKEALRAAVDENFNQYARSAGHLSLVNVLAQKYSAFLGRKVDPLSEVCVLNGASESLFSTMQGLLDPGDEVVVFEPAFDIYLAQADMAGAVIKPIPLRPNPQNRTWEFSLDELKSVFSERTRMLLLNTPHNPTGKVFTRTELESIAEIVRPWPRVVVVTDEVYENMIYPPHEHVRFASLPGMWDRCLTISSAGKTFSVTGWKIGWVVGPAELVRAPAVSHQWVCFSVHTTSQEAIARMFQVAEKPYEGHPSYYAWLAASYKKKRDFLVRGLAACGMTPYAPEGGFFVMADTSKLRPPSSYLEDRSVTRDWAVCRWLTREIGVAAIPPSVFYCAKNKYLSIDFARFAFCKPDEDLREAVARLKKLKDSYA